MGWDAPWHWVILAIVVIALFGYKKLPDASRAVGRSLRIFKTEIKGMTDDDSARKSQAEPVSPDSARSVSAPQRDPQVSITKPEEPPADSSEDD
jgi:sec-independent protein translocase protein TatA